MQTVTIAEKLWLEPTPLGVTLNFYEDAKRLHFRVGISFESLLHCESALREPKILWALSDRSLLLFGDTQGLTLAFSAVSTAAPVRVSMVLTGRELQAFTRAMNHFSAVALARFN